MIAEIAGALRLHLGAHPFLVMLAIALGCAALLRSTPHATVTRAIATLTSGASLLALVSYVGIATYYASIPQYFDAAEPTMTALGWLFRVGQPLYHAVDSPDRYSHIYGPLAFIVHGAALAVFGPSILVSKWVGASLALGALALTFVAARTTTSTRRALIITGACALLWLGFRNYSFWTRAEPLQAFCVAAGLVAALRARHAWGVLVVAACCGVLCNVKITGPAYALPVLTLVWLRAGLLRAIVGALLAAGIAVLPFALFAHVSATNYLAWVRLSAQTGLLLSTLRQNIEWLAFFVTPVVVASVASMGTTARDRDRHAWLALATGAAACGIAMAASKPGAGPYHFLPLLPVFGYLVATRITTATLDLPSRGPWIAVSLACVVVSTLVALTQQAQFLSTLSGRRTRDTVSDIRSFVGTHDGVVEMGYGTIDPHTYERPLLVFRNGSYFLDQPAIGEHQLAGQPVPAATIDALRRCRVDYWLVPRDEPLFGAVNMYASVYMRPLYPDAFKAAFLETYVRIGATRYFDVWQCRARVVSPAAGGR